MGISSSSPIKHSYERVSSEGPVDYSSKNASLLSRATFWHVLPLLRRGQTRPIDLTDLEHPADDIRVESLVARYDSARAELHARHHKSPSITRVLLTAFGPEWLVSVFYALVTLVLPFFCLYYIKELVTLFSLSPSDRSVWWGLALSIGMIVTPVLTQAANGHHYLITDMMNQKMRALLSHLVYRKVLQLSASGHARATQGVVMNHLATDVQSLWGLITFGNSMWLYPAQVAVGLVLLWQEVRWAVLVGLLAVGLLSPLSMHVARSWETLEELIMDEKSERVKVTAEAVSGVRVLKFFGWEDLFHARLEEYRAKELTLIQRFSFYRAAAMTLWSFVPMLFASVTFLVYAIFIGSLSLVKVLAVLTLFSIIQFPLQILPIAASELTVSVVSFRRLLAFLDSSEVIEESSVTRTNGSDGCREGAEGSREQQSSVAVRMECASLSWRLRHPITRKGDTSSSVSGDNEGQSSESDGELLRGNEDTPDCASALTLVDINLTIPKGKLTVVVGSVASGKSSLLSAILGEMTLVSGRVTVSCPSVALTDQEPWILNATVRENILFGLTFEPEWYSAVVAAACLEDDIAGFPYGHDSELGERGLNLSGGQKQRIALARALYRRADLYLLDDPLAAVDAHVGAALLSDAILTLLSGKTVILVTHQIHVLSYASHIVVMEEGRVAAQGTYQELSSSGLVASLAAAFTAAPHSPSLSSPRVAAAASSASSSSLSSAAAAGGAGVEGKKLDPFAAFARPPAQQELGAGTAAAASLPGGGATPQRYVEEEERATGAVSSSLYAKYFRALGVHFLVTYVVFLMINQGLLMGSSWWLASSASRLPPLPLTSVLSGYVGLTAASVAALAVGQVVIAWAFFDASKKIHGQLLRVVLHAPMWWFDSTPVGRVVTRFSENLNAVDTEIPENITEIFSCAVDLVCLVALLTLAAPPFLLLFPVIAWVYLTILRLYSETAREVQRLYNNAKAPILTHMGETMAGLRSVRCFGAQERLILENGQRLDARTRCVYPVLLADRWLNFVLASVSNVVMAVPLLLGLAFPSVVSGSLVTLSLTFSFNAIETFTYLVEERAGLENRMTSVERLAAYMDLPQEAPARLSGDSSLPSTWPSKGCVEFRAVTMSYKGGSALPVLRGVSATIEGGQKVGVVGRTGAGKSSLMLCLFRLVELSSGSIFVDGVDIKELGLSTLRERIAIIPQDPTLFVGTLRFNLDPHGEATDAALWEALECVEMKTAIAALPGGLDTSVVEQGKNFSVGQKQLLCFARALLRHSKIIVLDECTASVDFATDAVIQRTIRTRCNGVTVLTIAHRIGTISDYDAVMVLDDGLLVEHDKPSVLLKKKDGRFERLARESGLL